MKASNIEFSFLLLFGISGLHILAVLNVSEPSNLLCIASHFWRYFVLNFCVRVLLTKTIRITSVLEVDKVAQLFIQSYKILTTQTIFISLVKAVAASLFILRMSTDPPGREKIIRSYEYSMLPSIRTLQFNIAITFLC